MYIMEKLNEQSQELIKKWELKQELKLFPIWGSLQRLDMPNMKFYIQFIYESIKNENK